MSHGLALATVLLFVACGSPATGTGSGTTATQPANGRSAIAGQVVVAASVADNQDIYVEDLASGRLTRLTRDLAPDGVPVWSPSGTRLAFVRFATDGSSLIHLMNADGTGDEPLTNRPTSHEILPSWSPNGRQLAFADVPSAGSSQIFTIFADGTGLRQLTHDPAGHPNDPIWSPDGSLIAFDAGDPKPALFVMAPDGSHLRRLTPPDAQLLTNWPLSWSPDGSAVAFAGTGPDGTRDVYVVSSEGAQSADLTKDGRDEGAPAWSPDGRRLAFWSNRDGQGDIYVVAREGGGLQRLTTGSGLVGTVTLAWSPDGRQLIVWNLPQGQEDSQNYILDENGGDLRVLTSELSGAFMAFWRPNG